MSPSAPTVNEDWSQISGDIFALEKVDPSIDLLYLDDILKVLDQGTEKAQEVDIFDSILSVEDDCKKRRISANQDKPKVDLVQKTTVVQETTIVQKTTIVQETTFVQDKEAQGSAEPEVQIIQEIPPAPKPKRKYTRRKPKVTEQPTEVHVAGPMRTNGGSYVVRNAPYEVPTQQQLRMYHNQQPAMVHSEQLQYWVLPQQYGNYPVGAENLYYNQQYRYPPSSGYGYPQVPHNQNSDQQRVYY